LPLTGFRMPPSLPGTLDGSWGQVLASVREGSDAASSVSIAATTTIPPVSHPGPSPSRVSSPALNRKRKAAPSLSGAPTPPALRPSSNVNSIPVATTPLRLREDRLGTLVRQLSASFASATSWSSFVAEFRGRSYLSPDLDSVDHPAADLLRLWRDEGVPALSSSPPWCGDLKDTLIERGCHRSATEHADFLREEMAEFIENRFWTVLPYRLVRELPQLQLSPAAVKEERERKPRILCDHSWYPVNETTLPHAPPEAMQFGGTLGRLLHSARHALSLIHI
jgi:hypothetical protein